jgi:hypothetical protein
LWLNGVIGPDAPLFGQVYARYPDMEELFALAKRRTFSTFAQWGLRCEPAVRLSSRRVY